MFDEKKMVKLCEKGYMRASLKMMGWVLGIYAVLIGAAYGIYRGLNWIQDRRTEKTKD